MNKDKWTQQLHDKLADREVSAPEGLWADIEAALPEAPVGQSTRRSLLIPWRRWAIAASLAALVAGGGYLWWPTQPDAALTASLGQQSSQPAQQQKPQPEQTTLPEETTLPEAVSQPEQASHPMSGYQPLSASQPQKSSQPQEVSQPHKVSQPEEKPQPEQSSQPVSETTEVTRQLDTQIAMLTPKAGRRATISLYAANGLSNLQEANGVRMSDELAQRYDMSSYLPVSAARTRAASEIIYLTGYEERQKHYQPIAFGLTIGYPLSARLSLSTGVVYTRLRSDFTSIMNDISISRQQTLHYLGIPLNAQYHLWHHGHLNVYLSAGGQADYNIKAKMTSFGVEQQMSRDRWQFSLQGGVGIQYDLLPQLGLYAEPGVKYYFDNGSLIHNFFKDKPLDFNLQVGLRLNITK